MCGIAGVFHRDGAPASAETVAAMTALVAHRGPDGVGAHVDGPVGLGHRRLAIIDLSDAAAQPMLGPDGRYALVYNGEIYNFRELRAALEARGRVFVTRSDSEVLLAGFAEWGAGVLPRLDGMFAFAIWDAAERRLTLARDRFGVKPLYYAEVGGALLFASEIKALRGHPLFRTRMDLLGLQEYLSFQNFFSDRTLFEGVRLLPQGALLEIVSGGGAATPRVWWDFDFQEPQGPFDEAEAAERLDSLFQAAVRRQLVSDVPVGAYLSGGIDSGSVTAIAAREIRDMRTFTVGFDLSSASGVELGFDERARAEHLSYLFKTEHYEMVLKAGDMERCLPAVAWHLDEPRVGQSYPNYYAAGLASKFVKVCLSGAGGDEMFGGYPWRYYRAVVNDGFDDYIAKYFGFWQRILPSEQLSQVMAPVWGEVKAQSPLDVFRGVFKAHAETLTRPEDYINHSLYFEARTFLNGLLLVEDKLAMAHGLEVRVPFLDNDLVDFAMRLPARARLGNLTEVVRFNENEPGGKTNKYFAQTRDGKLLLRRMMQRYVSPDIAQRVKQGFSAPDASWFKGESIDYVRRRLMHPGARLWQFLDRRSVEALVADHFEGRVNRRLLIWSLLSLEQWCEAFL